MSLIHNALLTCFVYHHSGWDPLPGVELLQSHDIVYDFLKEVVTGMAHKERRPCRRGPVTGNTTEAAGCAARTSTRSSDVQLSNHEGRTTVEEVLEERR